MEKTTFYTQLTSSWMNWLLFYGTGAAFLVAGILRFFFAADTIGDRGSQLGVFIIAGVMFLVNLLVTYFDKTNRQHRQEYQTWLREKDRGFGSRPYNG